jgi:hypothetical protein
MIICKQCGVELESNMLACSLCDTPVLNDGFKPFALKKSLENDKPDERKKHLLSQVLWQIAAVLLLSGIAATLVINLAIEGAITWSMYPISICLMILPYVLLMSLWRTKITNQLLGGKKSWILL